MQDFVLRGKTYRSSKEEIEQALKKVEPEPVRKYYIEVDGIRYPIKQPIELITGLARVAYTAMDAYRILSRLGFEIRQM
jgi:hypothetical protein